MGYTKNALQGSSWNGSLKILTAVLTIAKIYVLSRLLSRSDFGLFSLTAITLGLTEAFTETGINTIIINSKRNLEYFLDTAWVIAIVRGLLISVVMLIAGFFMRAIYQEEQLLLMIGLASFIPLIKGFINPAIVKFQKDLLFFQDTLYRFSLELVNVVVTIALAVIFQNAYVFILGMIITALWEVAISFIFISVRPQFHYIKSRAQEVFSQTKGLNLSAVLSYAVQNIDNMLVGRILGTEQLGLYANGYSLSHRFNLELAKSVQHGTFPVYVKIADDTTRLRKAFWKTFFGSVGLFTVLSLPLMIAPEFFVKLLLSDKWLPIVPILPWLLVAGIIQSLITVSASVIIVRKKLRWSNISLFTTCVGLLIFLPIFAPEYGLKGAVMAVVISRAISLPVMLFGVKKVLYEK